MKVLSLLVVMLCLSEATVIREKPHHRQKRSIGLAMEPHRHQKRTIGLATAALHRQKRTIGLAMATAALPAKILTKFSTSSLFDSAVRKGPSFLEVGKAIALGKSLFLLGLGKYKLARFLHSYAHQVSHVSVGRPQYLDLDYPSYPTNQRSIPNGYQSEWINIGEPYTIPPRVAQKIPQNFTFYTTKSASAPSSIEKILSGDITDWGQINSSDF